MMFATIREWKGKREKMEETARKVREQIVPEFREIEGFLAYNFVDSGDDTVMTVSVFEDEEGAKRSTEVARGFAERELEDVVEGPPRIVEGEVAVHSVSEGLGRTSEMAAGAR